MSGKALSIVAMASVAALALLLAWWMLGAMGDQVWCRSVEGRVMIYGSHGFQVVVDRAKYFDPDTNSNVYRGPRALLAQLRTGPAAGRSFAGIEVYWEPGRVNPQFRAVVIPMVYPLLLTTVAPAAWVVLRLRRRNRLQAGNCAHCGYNLRGNQSGRCPECGLVVPAPSPPTAADRSVSVSCGQN